MHMPRIRKGLEFPIIPEDFIISRKKPHPKKQTASSIFAKQRPGKFDWSSGQFGASGKKRKKNLLEA
jgi:lipoprotein-anchoring transpeptidase ErfK/SrfK